MEGNWFMYALGAFLSYGMVNVLFKVGAESKLNEFLIALSLYLSAGVLMLLYIIFSKYTIAIDSRVALKSLILGSFIGVFSLLGTLFFQWALKKGPGSLVTPIMNLNGLLVVLVSILVYKEGLTATKLLGIVLAFIAIVLIRL